MSSPSLRMGAVALVLFSGCYTIRYHRSSVQPEAAPRYDRWHHDAVAGLLELSDTIKVDEVCPGGFAEVKNQVSFLNFLAFALVQGVADTFWTAAVKKNGVQAGGMAGSNLVPLWTPTTVKVVCAAGEAPALPVSAVPGAKARQKQKLAVIKLVALSGVEPSVVDLFTEALVAELRKQHRGTVMSNSDIAAVLGAEQQKALLGCTETSCIGDIGGALGVDRLIHGSIGRVGNSLMVVISSVDAKRARAVTTVSERIRAASDEAFLDALPGIAARLLNESAEPAR